MRVALVSRYPTDRSAPRGGVEVATVVLADALVEHAGVEVHVVTLERGRERRVLERQGRVTVHRLVGSRWPQFADVSLGPGRRRLARCLALLFRCLPRWICAGCYRRQRLFGT